MANEKPQRFTVIILGGGPAGISAAMGFLEARVDCLLIDQGTQLGGQVLDIPSYIANLPGCTFENGKALALALQNALTRAQESALQGPGLHGRHGPSQSPDSASDSLLTIRQQCRVTAIHPDKDSVLVQTNKDTYIGEYLLVATGYRVKMLDAPEGGRFARHWHNDTDDLPEDPSQLSLALVGSGDSALLKAIGLAERAKQVHLIARSKTLKGRPDLIEAANKVRNCKIHAGFEIAGLAGDKALERIVLRDRASGVKKEIEASEMIIKVGYEPNTEVLQDRVHLSPSRHVNIDAKLTTSHPRIYAAGDIVNEFHPRIASAVGQGMMASGQIIDKVFGTRRKVEECQLSHSTDR
jgi:thioredoxin reductase (NADPH)